MPTSCLGGEGCSPHDTDSRVERMPTTRITVAQTRLTSSRQTVRGSRRGARWCTSAAPSTRRSAPPGGVAPLSLRSPYPPSLSTAMANGWCTDALSHGPAGAAGDAPGGVTGTGNGSWICVTWLPLMKPRPKTACAVPVAASRSCGIVSKPTIRFGTLQWQRRMVAAKRG